jgi:hypothetical protein
VLIHEQGKAKVHLFFWTTLFVVALWVFWTRQSWWAELLVAALALWGWVGAVASARAVKYGFYDIAAPDTDEEKAVAAKPSWLPVPLALLVILLLLKRWLR